MNPRAAEATVVATGVAYLLLLGWSINNVSYDLWGALIVIPIYGLIGLVFVRRTFRGSLQPLAIAMAWGLLVKLLGTLARYWVGFEAYGGGIDAGRYHGFATDVVGTVWSGEENVVTALPQGFGTPFLEHLTAFVYLFTPASQLAGFVTFSFIAYIGTVLTVKAAAIAIPGVAAKRYAWMCALFPSVVYWPASIGKEAAIMFGLGVATFGIASMLTYGRWVSSMLLVVVGLGFVGLVRPHIAGIWVAGALPALVVSLVRRSETAGGVRRRAGVNRFGIVFVLVVASIGLAVIASITIRYLAPDSDEAAATDNLSQIVEFTTERTAEGGSNFVPPSVSSPVNWPYAAVRTLTRPLPFEASGIAQLIAAAEMMVLLGVFALTWRRLANVPRLLLSSPYVTFAVTTLFLAGLAYSSFANLGILTRQKSLVFPLLLLLPCLPLRAVRRPFQFQSTPDSTLSARAQGVRRPASVVAVADTNVAAADELWA